MKKNMSEWEQFADKIILDVKHSLLLPIQRTIRSLSESMFESFINEQISKKQKKDKDDILTFCCTQSSITENLNDRIASVCAFQSELAKSEGERNHLVPKLMIQVTLHKNLGRNKKKYLEIRKRFPDADIFLYEFGFRKKDKWEYAPKWYKLVKDEFVEGDNYSDWLGVNIEGSKKKIELMKLLIAYDNMETMRAKIMLQILKFVEANSEEKIKLKLFCKDYQGNAFTLAFDEKEKEDGEEKDTPNLFVDVVPHEEMEDLRKKYEFYENNYPQTERLVFEFGIKKKGRWVYEPKWHRFEKGEWVNADGYCERIGKKIEVDGKEFL